MLSLNKYAMPVSISEFIRVSYSNGNTDSGKENHSVVFTMPAGTPIKSAMDGIVTGIGSFPGVEGEQNFVEIEHNKSEASIYKNISVINSQIKKAQMVFKGQVIGHSTGTDFRFEVLRKIRAFANKEKNSVEILWEK